MKKNYFYSIILFFTLTFCNGLGGEKKTNNSNASVSSEIIDTSKQEPPFKPKRVKVLHSNSINQDTIVSNYHISYIIQDSDDVIMTYPITDGKGLDTVYYAGKEIVLNIKYLENNILHKKINKYFFSSYIPKKEMEKFSISYFNIDKVDNGKIIFFIISLCIPETDICYWFELSVSNKGDIEIKNTTLDEDEDM